MKKPIVMFVTGIDTGIGKSYATGYLAKQLNQEGIRTVTQKLIQTGNRHISEDIEMHRRIMEIPFLAEDHERLTMPEIFSYPCSPHLAAEIDGRPISLEKITDATRQLTSRFDCVLLEGAGGLMVPLTRSLLTIDYIAAHQYPVVLVTSGRLGSINQTLLSLEALKHRNIELYALVYNEVDSTDKLIDEDTRNYLKTWLSVHFSTAKWITLPRLSVMY